MTLEIENLAETTKDVKSKLRDELPNYGQVFRELEADMRRQVAAIVADREAGRPVVPVLPYTDVEAGNVSPQAIGQIKARGCCVIRGVFEEAQARAWDNEIAAYVEDNRLDSVWRMQRKINTSARSTPANRRSTASTGQDRKWKRANRNR